MKKQPRVIDLTHTVSADVPAWDGKADFELLTTTDYPDCVPPNLFRINKLAMGVSVGTHIDAPAHVIPGGRTVDQLTPEELVADCVVIDVSAKADQNYLVTPADIEVFEQAHGTILEHTLVIIYTGWSKWWDTPAHYHNDHVFPGVTTAAAELLVRRNIVGLAIDTFSCDTGQDGFPVHRAVLGADKYLVENVANADLLPPFGATAVVLPTKLKDATEAPLRLVALVEA
ncbi:MAG TPA: cyclase family protein [Candidatus Saccharimonadales bacterium]|nr:cyclase family protein [Candidatus Saccharimonadales bacterium]